MSVLRPSRQTVVGWLIGLAILALVVWIARNTYWTEITVPTPMKGEAATNPFYAAQRFVENLGASSRWDRLQSETPTEAVIVLTAWHWDLVEGRRQRMERWVEAGGRLVVDRSLVGGEDVFEEWSGITQQFPPEEDEDEEENAMPFGERPPRYRDTGTRGCRDLREVAEDRRAEAARVETDFESAPRSFELCERGTDYSHLVSQRPVTWALEDDVGLQALRVRVGEGSVTVINAVPFRNREFLRGEHAALLVAATQLRRGDDVHFLSEEDHPSILSLAWLYGWPTVVLVLAFFGLALWRIGVRFGPLAAQPDSARRSLAEQIRGTGQFAIRFGGGQSLHAATVRALNEAARRRVGAYERLSVAERVDTLARLTGIDAAALGPALHFSGTRRSHELRDAIALLESARRRLL